ncbi:MAG: Fic family protein [Oscillospiraceae bacterium]
MPEQDVVGAKQQYLLKHPIQGRFTATHLCNVHRFLFEDVYPFAGRFRLETIKKGETTFENEKAIPVKLHKLLDKLKQERYLTELPHVDFVARLTYYLAELNYSNLRKQAYIRYHLLCCMRFNSRNITILIIN